MPAGVFEAMGDVEEAIAGFLLIGFFLSALQRRSAAALVAELPKAMGDVEEAIVGFLLIGFFSSASQRRSAAALAAELPKAMGDVEEAAELLVLFLAGSWLPSGANERTTSSNDVDIWPIPALM